MIDHTTLPPSSAGIGRRLNKASDRDINPANARYPDHPQIIKICCQALITQAGPDIPLSQS